MIFSNVVSKLGKGEELSAFMPNKNTITLYYYNSGVGTKTIDLSSAKINLKKSATVLPYHKVIQITNNYWLSRLDKSFSIFQDEGKNNT